MLGKWRINCDCSGTIIFGSGATYCDECKTDLTWTGDDGFVPVPFAEAGPVAPMAPWLKKEEDECH